MTLLPRSPDPGNTSQLFCGAFGLPIAFILETFLRLALVTFPTDFPSPSRPFCFLSFLVLSPNLPFKCHIARSVHGHLSLFVLISGHFIHPCTWFQLSKLLTPTLVSPTFISILTLRMVYDTSSGHNHSGLQTAQNVAFLRQGSSFSLSSPFIFPHPGSGLRAVLSSPGSVRWLCVSMVLCMSGLTLSSRQWTEGWPPLLWVLLPRSPGLMVMGTQLDLIFFTFLTGLAVASQCPVLPVALCEFWHCEYCVVSPNGRNHIYWLKQKHWIWSWA